MSNNNNNTIDEVRHLADRLPASLRDDVVTELLVVQAEWPVLDDVERRSALHDVYSRALEAFLQCQ